MSSSPNVSHSPDPVGPTTTALHRNVATVIEAGDRLGLTIEPVRFPDGCRTAADAAAAIGVGVAQIVKSLVFGVGDPSRKAETQEIVLAYVSGDRQLDPAKLASVCGTTGAWRVDADTVREATGFVVGGVAPIGHRQALRAFTDRHLLDHLEVWGAAGTPHDVFALDPRVLVDRIGAPAVDLTVDSSPD